MAEPLPEALFDALMARAGIAPTATERAGLLAASRHIVAITDRLRQPYAVAIEPATIFTPGTHTPGTPAP